MRRRAVVRLPPRRHARAERSWRVVGGDGGLDYGRPRDLSWLADNLPFMYKTPKEHAATMANGIRFDLKLTDAGLVGKPQAVDLDDIASPPKDPKAAPYRPGDRDDYPDGSRWVDGLRIE